MIDPSIIDAKFHDATGALIQADGQLDIAIANVGMSRKYSGHDPQLELKHALEHYIGIRAQCALLDLIRSPDFYSALMRSAAEIT